MSSYAASESAGLQEARLDRSLFEMRRQGSTNPRHQFVLNFEQLLDKHVKALGPDLSPRFACHQPHADPQPVAGVPQAPPQNMTRAEPISYLGISQIRDHQSGRPGDHLNPGEPGELAADILKQTLGYQGLAVILSRRSEREDHNSRAACSQSSPPP